jgi:hypothetical protein
MRWGVKFFTWRLLNEKQSRQAGNTHRQAGNTHVDGQEDFCCIMRNPGQMKDNLVISNF